VLPQTILVNVFANDDAWIDEPVQEASIMSKSKPTIVLRSILGLIFVAGPLATALHLAPEPALPTGAAAFTGALAQSGYMIPLLWGTEIAAGVLLLSGFATPFALVLLAPVIVNIDAFHVFLAPGGIPLAIVVSALEAFLAWRYREAFRPLFQAGPARSVSDVRNAAVRAA
jgi:hypothetical protein